MNQNASLPDAATLVPAYTIETWPVGRLKAYERNARKHSPQQLRQLRDSFQKFGQVWPVLVREDGTIIAGHGRIEAAKTLGLTEVRVIIATGWSDEQCRAFGILDNKLSLNSTWDEALLGAELADLAGFGVDLGMLGFSPQEVEAILPSGTTGLTDPDETPEPPVNPVSRPGDVWLLGRHRILCGDSTKAEDVARVLGGMKPHLMVTDPPYGVNYDPNWRNEAGRTLDGGFQRLKSGKAHEPIGARALGKVQNDDRSDWREA